MDRSWPDGWRPEVFALAVCAVDRDAGVARALVARAFASVLSVLPVDPAWTGTDTARGAIALAGADWTSGSIRVCPEGLTVLDDRENASTAGGAAGREISCEAVSGDARIPVETGNPIPLEAVVRISSVAFEAKIVSMSDARESISRSAVPSRANSVPDPPAVKAASAIRDISGALPSGDTLISGAFCGTFMRIAATAACPISVRASISASVSREAVGSSFARLSLNPLALWSVSRGCLPGSVPDKAGRLRKSASRANAIIEPVILPVNQIKTTPRKK